MINRLSLLWRCIVGPAVHTRYVSKPSNAPLQQLQQEHHSHSRLAVDYEPASLESITTTAITGTMFVLRLLYALWPIVLPTMYRRGYFCRDGAIYLSKTALVFAIVFLPVYFLRGLSRYMNGDYVKFIKVLVKAQLERQSSSANETMEQLRMYDFEFDAWPVDYIVTPEIKAKHPHLFVSTDERRTNPIQYWINSLVANIIGIRMIYPGCTGLINAMVGPQLVIERTKWLTERGGRRFKLKTPLGDEIDSCFVDRRDKSNPHSNGNVLVICAEGNAGFWEVGAMTTPNPLGYSLLGWNHPGFAGSSGWPFPANDRAAIASVYLFATTELGFSSQDIVVFAWSIGGYTSSWLASVAKPPVRALMLDATFDNIEAMAQRQMPQILHPLVISTIHSHFDLDVARNVRNYSGPVLFVRRSRDEIISLVPGQLATNCINNLIVSTLRHRFPALVPKVDYRDSASNNSPEMETVDKMYSWLMEPLEAQTMLNFKDRSDCRDYIKSFSERIQNSNDVSSKDLGADQPVEFRRKLLAYVLLHCVKDFNATHCTPLPEEFFRIPANVV